MTTPTLSPDRPTPRPHVPAIVANPGRFCRACGVERCVIDRVRNLERQGRCESCAERGLPPMPPTRRSAASPAPTTAYHHPAPSRLAPATILNEDVATLLELQLPDVAPFERHVGLDTAQTLLAQRESLRQVLQAAARAWYRGYPDMSPAEQGRAHTHAQRILRAAEQLA